MILEPGDANRKVTVTETFHVQTDDELTDKEIKQIEADDQAIQTILLGLPEDIYADVDRYPTTAMNIALALMAKAFKLNYSTLTNNNQRISSNPRNRQIAQPGNLDGYNDVIRNQVIQNAVQNPRVQNIKNQNGLIGVQGNGNHNQIRNGNLVAARAERNVAGPRRRDVAYLQTQLLIAQKEEAGIQLQAEEYDLMATAADLDEIEEVNVNCILMANLQQASTSGTQTDSAPVYDSDGSAENGLIGVQRNGNQNQIGNGNLVAARAEGNAAGQNRNHIRCYNCRGVEEYDLMAATTDIDEIEEVNANCILMANLQQASTLGTQTDKAPVYDSDGSAEVYENCDDNEIFDMFTQEEQYTELHEPIPESHQVPQNDNDVISEVKSTIVTLQRVVKHRMTIEPHNWSSSAHQEHHKIVKDEIFPIVNQVDARVQDFEIQFLKEAAKFVGDFKSLANEADASLAKHKALELEIERLLKAVATYKNLFDSISVSRTQTKTIIASLQNELQSTIYKNAKLRTQLFKKVSNQKNNTHDMSVNTKFAKQLIVENIPKVGETNALSKPVTSNSVSTPQEPKVVKNDKAIAPGMFRINPGVDNTKTRRPQPRSNIKHDRVPSTSKSSRSKNKEAEIEEHHRNLQLSKNNKHISSTCNNIKIDSQDVISKVVCAMCKQCLISVNHDVCLRNYVNGKKSYGKKHKAKPRKPRFLLRWSPTGRLFDQECKIVDSSESESQSDCSKDDNACTSKLVEPKIKRFPNSTSLLGRAVCDSDLEVAFRRNACFIINLERVDLLKCDRSTNLYTINLHEMPLHLQSVLWLVLLPLSHDSGINGKSKRASHPPKPVPNSRQRSHLLYLDLCGPMRIASINGKWITVLLQSPVIIIRTDNGTEFKNQVLKAYFDTVGISYQMSSVRTPQQNGVAERQNWTLVEV
nr:hypothetical protein [Tanacetum cinerariifolium]